MRGIWFWVIFLSNCFITYRQLGWFDFDNGAGYIIFCAILFSLLLLSSRMMVFLRVQQAMFALFLVGHGVIVLTLPIGIVFALTGSYVLAIEILLTFYLPSILTVWLNFLGIYFLEKRRKKAAMMFEET